MTKLSLYLFNAMLLALLSGCSDKAVDNKTVWLGGEIINPKSNHVILYLNDFYDTLSLTNNRFLKRYDSLPPKIYYFRHGPEVQSVFLEPGDSVILRLNTYEFDESLAFSGVGSEKNNFLIDYFLERESNTLNPYTSTTLQEDEFIRLYDSTYLARIKILDSFLNSNKNESEYSKKTLNAFVKFPFYVLKEYYPYNFTKSHKLSEFYKPRNPDFYDHREKIDLIDEDLYYMNSFFQYVQYFLYNETIVKIFSSSKVLQDTIYDYAYERLHLIMNKISNPQLKDRLLMDGIHELQYENQSNPISQYKFLLGLYKENIGADKILKTAHECIALHDACLPGKKLENFSFYNLNNEKVYLSSFQEPLQIIFWRYSPLEYLHQINFELIESEFMLANFKTIFVLLDSEYKHLSSEFKSEARKKAHYFSKQSDSIGQKLYLYNSPKIYLLDENLTILPWTKKERRNKLNHLFTN